jgi:hypothetical protein
MFANGQDIISGTKVQIKTQVDRFWSCENSKGRVQVVEKASDNVGTSDEIFNIVGVGGGVLRSGDKVLFRTRVGYYLGCNGSSGVMQAVLRKGGNTTQDETFIIIKVGGNGNIQPGDKFHLKTQAEGNFYLNSIKSTGPVSAVEMKKNDPGRDETFTLKVSSK